MGLRSAIYTMVCPLLAGMLVLVSCGSHSDSTEQITQEPEIPPIGFFTENFEADTSNVQSGDTFAKMMKRLGMQADSADKMARNLPDSLFDVRKLRAGNHLHAYYDTVGGARDLRYVVYEHSRIRYTVFQCRDSLAVWNYEKPTVKERRMTEVTINSSLWNDLKAAGASTELIMKLNDIYEWSVDFFTLQKGDRFRFIYNQTLCDDEVVSIDTVHFSVFNGIDGKEVAALRFQTAEGGSNTYWDKGGGSLKRLFLKAPLNYSRVSSRFSYARKNPVTGKVQPHTAVDYAAPTGTPVRSIGDGVVTRCGWDGGGGGNRIRIKHSHGYETSYMHLSKFAKGIKEGVRVSQGQEIGYVGSTGRSTGPHLDFRVFQNGKAIDPLKLDSPASEPLNPKYQSAFDSLFVRMQAEMDSLSVR